MKFRHVATEIEAIVYTGSNKKEIEAFTSGQALTSASSDIIRIRCDEGDLIARPGDYIICGVSGEYYPCHPLVFEESYEPVKE